MVQSTVTGEYHGGRTSWRRGAKSGAKAAPRTKKYTQIFEKMESKPTCKAAAKTCEWVLVEIV